MALIALVHYQLCTFNSTGVQVAAPYHAVTTILSLSANSIFATEELIYSGDQLSLSVHMYKLINGTSPV